MTITREQVADLQPGDVVTVTDEEHPEVTTTGPLRQRHGDLWLGSHIRVRFDDGDPTSVQTRTLTVVSRAPRPLYVNHPRMEPVPGDVVRDADDGGRSRVWIHLPHVMFQPGEPWVTQSGNEPIRRRRSYLPTRLRLLVDGTTGQAVQ